MEKVTRIQAAQEDTAAAVAMADPISAAFLAEQQTNGSVNGSGEPQDSVKMTAVEADRRQRGRRASDRIDGNEVAIVDRRSGFDRRRGPGRRRSEDRRTAEEGEMNEDQFEFIMAIEEYKKVNRRPFPTWTEILDIIKALGYRKVAQKTDIA